MARRPRIPETVCNAAEDVATEYGYTSLGEAIRHMVQESGYDV